MPKMDEQTLKAYATARASVVAKGEDPESEAGWKLIQSLVGSPAKAPDESPALLANGNDQAADFLAALEAADAEENDDKAKRSAEAEKVERPREKARRTREKVMESIGQTDAVLAERIADEILHNLYCWSDSFGWMKWTGVKWERSNQETVTEEVRQHLINYVAEAIRSGSVDPAKQRDTISLLRVGRISAVVSLCKGMHHVQVRAEQFDTRHDLLNCPNGVVDLTTGELTAHDPELYLTKVTNVKYNPKAAHQDWDTALTALPKECAEWFQVKAGQGITGHRPSDDRMVILQGGGENGKSTMLDGIQEALGDYAVVVSDRVLLADPNSHPTELMDLRGARFALAEELPEEGKLSVKRLKAVVGTKVMKARYMRQDGVEWDATHSMFVSTNYMLHVQEVDHGTWRRLGLLKYPYKFLKPGQQPQNENEKPGDPNLRRRLERGLKQREAILAWLVAGARVWYDNDQVMPSMPDRMEEDTRAWRAESDLILAYWGERLVADSGCHVLSTDLMTDFNAWLEGRNHRHWSEKTFVARFKDHDETGNHGVEKSKIGRRPGLSRPEAAVEAANGRPVPAIYAAWVGVRFSTGEPVQGTLPE
ncbi:phage/plasmid primase, P4 family [Streptomyces sp. NPDC001222]|uniref:DNA primase family protein n=1 Tax=Streptomyces sp. NPDC001222 TaxID=3364548 RepID=UPI0036CA1509